VLPVVLLQIRLLRRCIFTRLLHATSVHLCFVQHICPGGRNRAVHVGKLYHVTSATAHVAAEVLKNGMRSEISHHRCPEFIQVCLQTAQFKSLTVIACA